MFDRNKFKSVRVLHGDTLESLGSYLNLSKPTISKKERSGKWDREEIALISKRYNLSCEEICDIFFNM